MRRKYTYRPELQEARALFNRSWLSGDDNGLASACQTFRKILVEMGFEEGEPSYNRRHQTFLTIDHPAVVEALSSAKRQLKALTSMARIRIYASLALFEAFPDEPRVAIARILSTEAVTRNLAKNIKNRRLSYYDPEITARIVASIRNGRIE